MDRVKQDLKVGDKVYISPSAYGDKDKTSRAKIIGIGKIYWRYSM